MEKWQKIAIGAGAVVLLIGVGVFGVSWWSHKGQLAALDIQNPTPEDIVKIVSLLIEKDGKVLGRVHQKLQGIGKAASPALAAQMKVGDPAIREEAARVLVELDPDVYIKEVGPLTDPAVNKDAKLLGALIGLIRDDLAKGPEGMAILTKAASDPDPMVTRIASERIPTNAAGQNTLETLMKSSDTRTSRHATRRLRDQRTRQRGRPTVR